LTVKNSGRQVLGGQQSVLGGILPDRKHILVFKIGHLYLLEVYIFHFSKGADYQPTL
jgi:hypothetical protein